MFTSYAAFTNCAETLAGKAAWSGLELGPPAQHWQGDTESDDDVLDDSDKQLQAHRIARLRARQAREAEGRERRLLLRPQFVCVDFEGTPGGYFHKRLRAERMTHRNEVLRDVMQLAWRREQKQAKKLLEKEELHAAARNSLADLHVQLTDMCLLSGGLRSDHPSARALGALNIPRLLDELTDGALRALPAAQRYEPLCGALCAHLTAALPLPPMRSADGMLLEGGTPEALGWVAASLSAQKSMLAAAEGTAVDAEALATALAMAAASAAALKNGEAAKAQRRAQAEAAAAAEAATATAETAARMVQAAAAVVGRARQALENAMLFMPTVEQVSRPLVFGQAWRPVVALAERRSLPSSPQDGVSTLALRRPLP
jgi:hypothetical protein